MNPERKLEKEIGQIVDSFIQKGIQIQDIKRYLKNNPKYVENKLQLLEDDFKDIAGFRESIKKYIGIILRDREYSIKDNMVKESKDKYGYDYKYKIGDVVVIKRISPNKFEDIHPDERKIKSEFFDKKAVVISRDWGEVYVLKFVDKDINDKHWIKLGRAIYFESEIELFDDKDDDSQFEDDFENEEYNYKENKFEIGDRVIIKVDVLEDDSSVRKIIDNTKEKTGKIVKCWDRKRYLVRFDNPSIVIRKMDGKKVYIRALGFNERDIKLYLEPEDDSQFEDDFENEKKIVRDFNTWLNG